MPRRPQSYSVREAVNESEVIAALLDATKGYGGVVRFAKKVGFSRHYVQIMLYGGGRVSTRVASALGYELRWVRKDGAK
jgi:DNA-binding phage protein